MSRAALLTTGTMVLLGVSVAAHPPARYHQADAVRQRALVPANQSPPVEGEVDIRIVGEWRVIDANAVPTHPVGRFPNRGNPHSIAEQDLTLRVPARPKLADAPTALELGIFGVAVNGVPFDPGAAEWYHGDRGSPWRYEALGGAVALGVDTNHAHVQPTGKYHYHGLPTGLLDETDDGTGHGPLVGWALDGFPIYALRGYADPADPNSGIASVRPGWRLKTGQRPGGADAPGGEHDGAFVADFEYVDTGTVLDECNGRLGATPEFPEGTYAYFLTADYPVIPRCFMGEPGPEATRRSGPPPRGKRPPPRGHRPF